MFFCFFFLRVALNGRMTETMKALYLKDNNGSWLEARFLRHRHISVERLKNVVSAPIHWWVLEVKRHHAHSRMEYFSRGPPGLPLNAQLWMPNKSGHFEQNRRDTQNWLYGPSCYTGFKHEFFWRSFGRALVFLFLFRLTIFFLCLSTPRSVVLVIIWCVLVQWKHSQQRIAVEI